MKGASGPVTPAQLLERWTGVPEGVSSNYETIMTFIVGGYIGAHIFKAKTCESSLFA